MNLCLNQEQELDMKTNTGDDDSFITCVIINTTVDRFLKKISHFKNQLESEKLHFDELVLPSYSSFYQIHNSSDINVSITSEQFVNAGNINSLEIEKILKNSVSKNRYFPLENLIVSEEMVFRGIVVKQITYYPFRIDLSTGEVQINENINISIEEIESDSYRNFNQVDRKSVV